MLYEASVTALFGQAWWVGGVECEKKGSSDGLPFEIREPPKAKRRQRPEPAAPLSMNVQ